jgi:nucleotide-binding universal stress UspA family protein
MTDNRVILVPLDGSGVAEGILPYAEALSQDLGESLRLMYVAPQAPHPDQPSAPEAGQTVAATAAELRTRGTDVTTASAKGDPALQILAAAEESDVDMVLMATHGRGGLERWLIGSVADEVMRRCNRPILLMVPSDFLMPTEAFKYRRLMVPLDGSPLAEAALPLAVRLAQASGAAILLVQALTPVASSLAPGTYIPDLGRWEEEQTAAAQNYLEGVATRIPSTVERETLVLRGLSPANSLVRFAQSEGVDLVVMSTHGHGGLQRLAVGSKADLMVRSAVPTLLVRPLPSPATNH